MLHCIWLNHLFHLFSSFFNLASLHIWLNHSQDFANLDFSEMRGISIIKPLVFRCFSSGATKKITIIELDLFPPRKGHQNDACTAFSTCPYLSCCCTHVQNSPDMYPMLVTTGMRLVTSHSSGATESRGWRVEAGL